MAAFPQLRVFRSGIRGMHALADISSRPNTQRSGVAASPQFATVKVIAGMRARRFCTCCPLSPFYTPVPIVSSLSECMSNRGGGALYCGNAACRIPL